MSSREGRSEYSRLELVKRTILSQIQMFKEMNPHLKICIIEFESCVKIHGDCSSDVKIVNDRILNDYDSLVDIAS